MRPAQRRAALQRALAELVPVLRAQGWVVAAAKDGHLVLERVVSPALNVRVSFAETPMADQVPAGHAAVRCLLLVHLPLLQEAISVATGAVPNGMPMVTEVLQNLCASAHLHQGCAHLVQLLRPVEKADLPGPDLQLLLADFNTWFVPLIARFDDESIWRDEVSPIPKSCPWHWSLLRLAHMMCRGDADGAAVLSRRLAIAVDHATLGTAANEAQYSALFRDMDALMAAVDARAIAKVSRFLAYHRVPMTTSSPSVRP